MPPRLAEAVALAEGAPLAQAVAIIRPLLTDIGWFHGLLEDGCRAMAADPLMLPTFRASISGAARHMVLARTERIWITATVVDRADRPAPTDRVHFSGRCSLSRSLAGPLQGEGFRLVAGQAVATGPVICPADAVLELDERHETVRISPGAGSLDGAGALAGSGPMMLLRAQVAPSGPVASSLHDATTGAAVASAQADEGHVRSLMLLSLLRVQGRRNTAESFAAALDAPLPAQRWSVMREYLALDTVRALPSLRAMAAHDSDYAVRGLALRTLRQIGGPPCPA